ncbi:hypothetical protein OKW41_002162 [Paraburkholderia sp. UCT70]|uniref:hypothetical protein n=1 Tax=Paraburkholderia sp. UCT70 TaxID=2991068 RepID=UPI003D1F38AA
MTWPLFASKAAPCDGAPIQRGGRLTRLFNMGLGAAAVRRSVLASPVAHLATLDRYRKAAVSAGCEDDLCGDAEFRCIAAKAQIIFLFMTMTQRGRSGGCCLPEATL